MNAKMLPLPGIQGPRQPVAHYLRLGHTGGLIQQIAHCAIEYGVDAILAPGDFLRQGHRDQWLEVDRSACIALRNVLDRERRGEM
ncbi:MAG: hypothetical protein HYR63_17530 [Proteobacteria bacterium]|nr:hypothetical protein [Pseudomonadota bacterium]MBI3499241.1 hypothetical protein [Pseudomonadota bacterium]